MARPDTQTMRAAGSVAAIIAVVALVGWLTDALSLASFGPDLIPMAPSTAALFVLFGIAFWRARPGSGADRSPERRGLRAPGVPLVAVGMVLAAVLLATSLAGIHPHVEHPGLPSADQPIAGGSPTGHMSPVTAFCFLIAGIAFLLSASSSRRGWGARVSLLLVLVVLATAGGLTVAYALGGPLLYGSGIIPPALSTSLAFAALAIALIGQAFGKLGPDPEDAFPRETGALTAPSLLLVGGVLLGAAILVAAYIWFQGYERSYRRDAENSLAAILDLKVQDVIHWRRERLGDARVFFENRHFSDLADQALGDPDRTDAIVSLEDWLGNVRSAYDYERISLLDPSGTERLTVPVREGPLEEHLVADALQAAATGEVELLDFHRDALGKTHLHTVVPLPSPVGGDRIVGVLVLTIDPHEYLYPFLQRWPTPSRTAETLLVRRDGDDVLFLNDLRSRDDAAFSLRIPLTETDVPAVMAVRGRQGVVEGRDYRGEMVVAATRAIPDTPWWMIARQDRDEFYAPLRENLWWLVNVIGALLLGLVAVVAAGWQRRQKRHYRRIAAQEERHGVTLQSIGDAVITTDARGRVELLNPVAEELTGWSHEAARGRPLSEVFRIVNEETREPVESPVEEVLRKGQTVGLANHTILVAGDGEERPIADSGAPIRGPDGNPRGVVLVFRDQSEERAAGRALRQSEERYRGLFETMAHGVIYLDPDGRIKSANPAAERILGRPVEEMVGMSPEDPAWDTVREDGTPFPPREHPVMVAARTGEPVLEVTMGVHNPVDDETHWLLINARPQFLDDAGQPARILATFTDITERKRAEDHRNELQAQLAQAQKLDSVGRLAGGVAHDFNNMLSVILGNVEMALEETDPESALGEQLAGVREAAQRSAELTGQLLAFARKQTVSPEVLDLNESVEATLRMLRRLLGEEIELRWQPASRTWPVKIDRGQLDQLLANVAVNARDAIQGRGTIVISTENTVFDEEFCDRHAGAVPGEYVSLSITDDGTGMDREIRERAFEPFFTTKGEGAGTGLGLATVYGIAKQNSGFVYLYSEPGEGTTVRLYLPRCAPAEEAGAEAESAAAESAAAAAPRGNETVLLVEDESPVLELTTRVLASLGYTVIAAGGPEDALRLAAEQADRIDLLLTDVIMPQMNGRELAERLAETHPDLKVLYTSGYPADVLAERGVLADGVHLVKKPFSMRELASSIRDVLGD